MANSPGTPRCVPRAQYAQLVGVDDNMEQVLQWVRSGVPMQFCRPDTQHKSTEPHHRKKVAAVRRALRRSGLSAAAMEVAMQRAEPPPCH